ncbi:MAG: dockerin type I domain-containing protein [Trueperaceae bacterium]|nr:dockerin type I domain-containing protein [Trueperaceae bacterium]
MISRRRRFPPILTLDASYANYVLGDVDQSGSVSIADASAVLNIATATAPFDSPSDVQLYLADLNGNRAITVSDAVLVLQNVVDDDLDADLVVKPDTLELGTNDSGLILVGNAGRSAAA